MESFALTIMVARHLLIGGVLLASMTDSMAGSGPDYRFERYWPAIQQPWYFRNSAGFVGPDGFVYVAESDQRAVRKFSRNGRLVAVFEAPGGLPKNLDFDQDGNVYVAVQGAGIVKYTADGRKLGTFNPPAFIFPFDVAVSGDRLYVGDFAENAGGSAGSPPVHELMLDGEFVTSWSNIGPDVGEVDSVISIAYHPDHGLLVADGDRDYLQQFQTDGSFVTSIPFTLTLNSVVQRIRFGADGKLYMARGTDGDILDTDLSPLSSLPFANGIGSPVNYYLGISPFDDGNLLVSDLGKAALNIMSPDGDILSQYNAQSNLPGRFRSPASVAVNDNFIYVLETFVNNRLQQFDLQGQYIRSIGEGTYGFPFGIALDGNGDVHVTDRFANAIYEFDAAGNLLSTHATGFNEPYRLGIDSAGNRVVTFYSLGGDSATIEIISPTGAQLDTWTILDGIDDQVNNIHVTANDDVWLIQADYTAFDPFSGMINGYNIGRFDLAGNLLGGWPTSDYSNAITVNAAGEVLLAGSGPIGVYDTNGNLLRQIGERGFQPGGFLFHEGLALGNDGRLVVSDPDSNRVQIFAGQQAAVTTRAIVVAGGGPYPGNTLWPATELNANFAYRTLVFQGLGKDAIQYLSSNTALDVDQNGTADDIDATASNANLRSALLGPSGTGTDGFSSGAEHLVVYLVDHGGLDSYRMSDLETLPSSQLASWLDSWQASNPGSRLTVIYDACQSGSFMDEISNPDFSPRHVITSSAASENAYFVSQGTLSFSNHFWTHIFNGLSIGEAYDLAATSTSQSFPNQNPLLDADGDGVSNTAADAAEMAALIIGNGTGATGSRPVIGTVDTGVQPVTTGNSATITATNVTDDEGVARVWVVLRPPNFNPGSPDNPIRDLPTFELLPVGGNDYAATFDGFNEIGTYQLTVNALDDLGNSAVPRAGQVSIQSPLKRRAVAIAGGAAGDQAMARHQLLSQLAVQALGQQGYGADGSVCNATDCDDVQYLIDAGVVGVDGTPVLANIEPAITIWGSVGVQDLTIYVVGEREAGGLRLSGGQVLTAAELNGYLQSARSQIPGVLTVIVDSDDAGGFMAQLTPAANQIFVASAGAGRTASFLGNGAISFSRFFWSQVLNGTNVGPAFRLSRTALNFSASGPQPELDDDGNGIPNQFFDGNRANRYAIGTGVLLAGDEPLIGSVSISNPLTRRAESIAINQVASTGSVVQAFAVVTQPDGTIVSELLSANGSTFTRPQSGALCAGAGNYVAALYAVDEEGLTSQPVSLTVTRTEDCTSYIYFDSFE